MKTYVIKSQCKTTNSCQLFYKLVQMLLTLSGHDVSHRLPFFSIAKPISVRGWTTTEFIFKELYEIDFKGIWRRNN